MSILAILVDVIATHCNHRHQIFDEYGKVVFNKEVKDKTFYMILNSYKDYIQSFYDAIVDGRLYKCSNGDAR